MKRLGYIPLFTVVLLFSFRAPANAKKFAVVGIPETQTRTTTDSAFNIVLDNNQKVSNRLVIVEDGGKYYWETRDHDELIFTKMQRFDLFIDPKTGGYVKVIKQDNGAFAYLEHISFNDYKTFTYWGFLNVYQP